MMYVLLFVVKILDNIILTAKSILQYRGAKIVSSILVIISQLLFYFIIAEVVEDDSILTIVIISIASGIGNLILCNYLVENNIKYLANHGINRKGHETINVIAYSKTKDQSRLIERYLAESKSKYLKEINR